MTMTVSELAGALADEIPAAKRAAALDEVLHHATATEVIESALRVVGREHLALVFPAYKDGRAYSQARLLRERYRFRGELRATGQVLRDQFLFLVRAGFDSFEVLKSADALAFEEATRRYSVFFQPTGDGRMTVARVRSGREAQAPHREPERLTA